MTTYSVSGVGTSGHPSSLPTVKVLSQVISFADTTNATGYSTLTATARHVAASADTLDVLVLSAASSAGKIRVWAIMCDVSGINESDQNTSTQHDTAV